MYFDDGDPETANLMRAAAERLETWPVLGRDYTKREAEAVAWLVGVLETEQCCTPGAIYDESFTPTEIRLTVRLPERLRLSDEVARQESKVLEGLVQRAVRGMLIQSGVRGLPCPVPLIPEHPKDEEHSRILAKAAQFLIDGEKDGRVVVPINPTPEMRAEGEHTLALGGAAHMIYGRMISAAPRELKHGGDVLTQSAASGGKDLTTGGASS